MKKTFLLLSLITLVFTSCSSDDDVDALDSISQTEWEITSGNFSYSIYFSTDGSTVSLNTSGQHAMGTFTYDKPTALMDFTEGCNDDIYFFSSCNISGNINGNKLTIIDDGEEFLFFRTNE